MLGTRTSRVPALAFLTALLAGSSPPGDADAQEVPPVARGDSWETDFSKHTVPLDQIVSGGPPKDGIPAIDDPSFVSVEEADDWLSDREPVAVVRNGDQTKAYPLQILTWHEIVNDRVGGKPISVTFCPLCNTTLSFEREFDGRILDFGTTGRLRHSDLVMYDRQTETWWQQATGEGIVGKYAGRELTFVPSPVLSWGTVKERHADALVLSRSTGHSRPYGRNPYTGYDSQDGPFSRFFFGEPDDRLPAMERIVALEEGGEAVAVPFSELEEEKVARVEVGGREFVVFWAPGTASALDESTIADGDDVGSTNVFVPEVGGRTLRFEPAGDGRFRDRETRSIWTMTGEAVRGPLRGSHLETVVHGNHFWFAWGVFRPETRVWRP